MKTFYSLGFLFDEGFEHVALIRKTKPQWQKGLLNGIGGKAKLEIRESALNCMIREFHEETNMRIIHWTPFAIMNGCNQDLWQVDCFYDIEPYVMFAHLESPTDEEVKVYETKSLRRLKTVSNLQWLIPLAIDHYKNIDYKIEIQQ